MNQACPAQKQLSKDSADFYLKKIDNYAVRFSFNDSFSATLNRDAGILYRNADKYIMDKLMDALENNSQVLVCHALLTKLLDPINKNFYYTTEDLRDTILLSCKFNGLSWEEIYDKINLTTEIRVDSSAMRTIKAYWV